MIRETYKARHAKFARFARNIERKRKKKEKEEGRLNEKKKGEKFCRSE